MKKTEDGILGNIFFGKRAKKSSEEKERESKRRTRRETAGRVSRSGWESQ